jgi:oligoendopeptidase F
MDLKAKLLGKEKLNMYDVYVNTLDVEDRKISYEEGKQMVLDGLNPLGEKYISMLKTAFENRWLDVYEKENKRGGAYSVSIYGLHPFVLLNYINSSRDVSTIAHELGHSMHSYYSRNNNPYIYSGYSIVVAEVASTVNELLLAKHVIKTTKDINEKLYILDRLMSLFKGTIYRQTMYEEFEKFLFETAEKDETLTPDLLCDYFYKLNKKYYGDSVVLDDVIKYEWGRMPHLYYNFYMYKYATGLSAACQIVNQILDNKENAVENYLEFLKTGSRMAPNEELKINGVDLTNKSVCDNAIKMFSEIVDDFEKTYKEYKKSSGDVNG